MNATKLALATAPLVVITAGLVAVLRVALTGVAS